MQKWGDKGEEAPGKIKSMKIKEIEGVRWKEEKCDRRGLSLDRVRIKISSVLFFPDSLLF